MKPPVDIADAIQKFGSLEEKPEKKIVYRRGRQRSKDKVRQLFYRYWQRGKKWPVGLSDDMQAYYKENYIKVEGKSHEDYKTWRKQYTEIFGQKFGNQENKIRAIRP